MDDDLSKENRIRLIGRLFSNLVIKGHSHKEMALSSFQNSAEPIKVYKVLVGAFVGNVGKNVGRFW